MLKREQVLAPIQVDLLAQAASMNGEDQGWFKLDYTASGMVAVHALASHVEHRRLRKSLVTRTALFHALTRLDSDQRDDLAEDKDRYNIDTLAIRDNVYYGSIASHQKEVSSKHEEGDPDMLYYLLSVAEPFVKNSHYFPRTLEAKNGLSWSKVDAQKIQTFSDRLNAEEALAEFAASALPVMRKPSPVMP